MSSSSQQPFIEFQAYNKANSNYVSFPSQADAMIASLQLSRDVPCHIMDLIYSVVTHPDFDARQVTLRNSTDVIDIVEENRMKDRMAVVHNRSLSRNGRMVQAGFSELVLDEVLDIIHTERMAAIRSKFEKRLTAELARSPTCIEEDDILSNMSLVHRSWTFPSQKALGRILFINKPTSELANVISPVRKSIFGSWTAVVALQLFVRIDQSEYDDFYFREEYQEEFRQWFENLHRILVGFTNLKSVFIESYASFFTKWSNHTIGELFRRNIYLEWITLHASAHEEPFILDPLIEGSRKLEFLQTLDCEGVRFSDTTRGRAMQEAGFGYLKNLTLKRQSSLEINLATLFILSSLSSPRLETLRLSGDYGEGYYVVWGAEWLSTIQYAVAFGQLHTLYIIDEGRVDKLLKWIGPYCVRLEDFTLNTDLTMFDKSLPFIPASIRSLSLQVIPTEWMRVAQVADWMKCILEIISSRHFLELKLLSLSLSGGLMKPWERDESHQREEHSLLNQLLEFEASMKLFCQSAGIEYSFDLHLRCSCTDHSLP